MIIQQRVNGVEGSAKNGHRKKMIASSNILLKKWLKGAFQRSWSVRNTWSKRTPVDFGRTLKTEWGTWLKKLMTSPNYRFIACKCRRVFIIPLIRAIKSLHVKPWLIHVDNLSFYIDKIVTELTHLSFNETWPKAQSESEQDKNIFN